MMQSDSSKPDLDWSQVRETVKLLTLSVTQVEANMHAGDSSVNTLTESFTAIVDHLNSINNLLATLPEGEEKDLALQHCTASSEKVQTSIVAFQFYDRLQQSLLHVANSLKGLAAIVESPERLYSPIEWKKFQDEIRSQYTMESEKAMFDAVLQGKSVEEALQMAVLADQADDDEVELF